MQSDIDILFRLQGLSWQELRLSCSHEVGKSQLLWYEERKVRNLAALMGRIIHSHQFLTATAADGLEYNGVRHGPDGWMELLLLHLQLPDVDKESQIA